jgi:hypothetical protein
VSDERAVFEAAVYRSRMASRHACLGCGPSLPVAALLFAAACGAPPPVAAPSGPPLCTPDDLASCERRLVAVDEEPSRSLAAAYVAARAARDPADPWVALYRGLDAADRGAHPSAAIVVLAGAPGGAASLRSIQVAALPAPAAVGADALLLALSAAAGYREILRVERGSVTRLYPADPMAPWMAGLNPVLRDADAVAHADADLAAEDALHDALEAASAFRYLEAAKAAERLAAFVDREAGERGEREPVLRFRFALQTLGAAGLVLDPDEAASGAATSPPPAVQAAPAASDATPYGAYLRVALARDPQKAWVTHGPRVLEGIRDDRREALTALYAGARECGARSAPPMDGVRDLVFANKLSGALQRDATGPVAPGQLPLRAWLERYDALVGLVDRTRSAWSYLPSLLHQRGDVAGYAAAGTTAYRRVTDLGVAHLAATKTLEEAYPVRYRAFTQVSLATSVGALTDETLRRPLVKLVEASVQDRIAAAPDAEGLLGGLAAGAAAGISYPPALQEPHFTALAGALAARLHGDLQQRNGWGVALLYGIDAAYRVITDRGAAPAWSADQIARALAAPSVEHPALASLVAALARYGALALDHKLDPARIKPDELGHERRAARAELRAALAGLGAKGEAPENVLDDVTTLADGLIATLATALTAGAKPKPDAKLAACGQKSTALPLDPALRRALGKLGDVRRRVLLHPRYKQGDGAWVRRVRLLVTVLSDAMDLALAGDAPMQSGAATRRSAREAGARREPRSVFAIPREDARRAAEDALREVDQKAVVELVAGGYGLFRELATMEDPADAIRRASADVRRVGTALLALFRGDALGGKGPSMGVALLDALAGMRVDGGGGDDVAASLAAYASAFYAKGQPDQGDLCLLAGYTVASFAKTAPPAGALELATREHSRVAWVLRFADELRKNGSERRPDPAAYADELRKATDDACQAPDAEATLAVMQAIHDFGGGQRRRAREALDKVLDDAEERGLGVPRIVYQYQEKTATKVFQLSFDLSYANGILLGANSFQVGLGFRSPGEPGGSLTATLAPRESAKAGEDAARYYVYTAALASVYHFLEGDTERGASAARRAVGAVASGLTLGHRRILAEKAGAWTADSQSILALAAQLAAEAGQPFLAGDLWTIVRQSFPDTLDDKGVSAFIDRSLVGLSGIKELAPVAERARRSLRVLAARLPCADHKVELGGFEEVACADYPLALSLRIADALKKLPRLRRGAEGGARCGAMKSLDAFLAGAERGGYDPDAFTRAVDDLRADGETYDAAVLLGRHKRAGHCSPPVLAAARALGRSPTLGPSLRADLLSAAVNCTAVLGGPEVKADLALLDGETRKLPDAGRNVQLVLSLAELASRTDQWEMVTQLVDEPEFVGRWTSVHPNAGAAALLLDHAVSAIASRRVALERTKAAHQMLCETFRSADRAELCSLIDALRAPLAGPMSERQRFAKDAVRKLVASAATPPAPRGPKRP